MTIRVVGSRIAAIEPAWPNGDVSDWPFVAPGLFDLQVNGHGGVWFSSPDLTPEKVVKTLEPYYGHGVTRMLPTLVTASHEALATGFAAIREACEQTPWVNQMVPGCHLEGPFISSEDGPRGAHPIQHVRPADWEEFQQLQEISGNRIRLVTLAAESENAVPFIRESVASGVRVAIGHTMATGEQIQAAVEAGAGLSTHLGNGAHGTMRRHPNYIWEQLGEPALYASIITDGHHLPKSVVRSIIRTKGSARTILTCDAAGWAGCAPGIYQHGPGKVEILQDGRIVIAGQNQLLAGSSLATDTCVVLAMNFGGVTLREAIDMACGNPARFLGFRETRLMRGDTADLFLFRMPEPSEVQKLKVLATVASGELRFGTLFQG